MKTKESVQRLNALAIDCIAWMGFSSTQAKQRCMYDVYGPPRWRSGTCRALPSHAGDRGSISSRDRPKSLKREVTAPLTNARGQVWVSLVLRDDHYKGLALFTVGMARWWTPTAQWLWVVSIGQILKQGPSSVMVISPNEWKILEWDEKPQTNKQTMYVFNKTAKISSPGRDSKIFRITKKVIDKVHPGVSVLIFVLILLFYYEVEYGPLSLPFHFNFLA